MAHVLKALVGESSTSTGTGAFTLDAALAGHRRFSAVCAVGDTVEYAIRHESDGSFETGVGTYSAANTLTRTSVVESSNANAAVSFAAGNKVVTLTPLAFTLGRLDYFTSKATPVDADAMLLSDSTALTAPKKLTWANLKATLKTYFDTLYGTASINQNSKSAAYTLVLGDANKHLLHPSADTTARTFTIPANSSVSFPIGTAVTFVNQNGAGTLTIAITTDTLRLAGPGTTGSRTLAANGIATALKVTSTEWIISGTGLT